MRGRSRRDIWIGFRYPIQCRSRSRAEFPENSALSSANFLSLRFAETKPKCVCPPITLVRYHYDAAGRRIAAIASGVTTLHLYDGWNCPLSARTKRRADSSSGIRFSWSSVNTNRLSIAEYAGQTLVRTYLWGMDLSGSMQGAGGVGGLLAVRVHGTAAATYYPVYDGNGNVSEPKRSGDGHARSRVPAGRRSRQYLDASGVIKAHFEYDPFGNTLAVVNLATEDTTIKTSLTHRFSTKPRDAVTGLYYYGYRFYDPVTGRWPSRDPIGEEGGVNLYGFVSNKPCSKFDGFGLADQSPTPTDESMNTACEQSKAKLLSDKDVKLITDSLDKHKDDTTCAYEPIECKFRRGKENPSGKTRGWGLVGDNGPKITICANVVRDEAGVKDILIHELTHATQRCRKTRHLPYEKLDYACEVAICNELEAYSKEPTLKTTVLQQPGAEKAFLLMVINSIWGEDKNGEWKANPPCEGKTKDEVFKTAGILYDDCTGLEMSPAVKNSIMTIK